MEMTQQLMQIAQEALTTAEALANAKEVSQVDVIRARVELQSGELMLKGARNQLTAAWSQLAAVVAMPDIMPRPLSGDLTPPATRIDFDSTLRQLLAESPEMSAALSEVERARWAVERAYAEPVPNVDVQAVVQSDNGTGGSNANLQVTLPIPWLNRNQGGIQQAHAQLVAAERAVGVTELSLHQRLASVYQQYETARNQVEDYLKNDGILANTKASLDLVHQGYQNGESGYLELLTAQRTHFQTNLAYVEALGDLFSSVIQMEGMLLSGSLQE
jgi:cobalt-zinc-cadmium efflux system outer membrane protein